jgi:hypothetical protein
MEMRRAGYSVFGLHRFSRAVCLIFAAVYSVISVSAAVASPPVIFWASDPVGPNETALIVGDALGEATSVRVEHLRDNPDVPGLIGLDARSVVAERKSERSLYFVLPADLQMGVYKYEVVSSQGVASGFLNRPTLYWGQGDLGSIAAVGGQLRVFGRAIAFSPNALIALEREENGARTVLLASGGSPWTASAAIPSNLPPGNYRVTVWNGHGGIEAWSDPLRIEIQNPPRAPQRVLSVKDFGAKGNGKTDDANAIDAGLAELEKTGGTLFFPRGRFFLSRTLVVPPGVTLKGVNWDMASLLWPDFDTPPETLIEGSHDFSIEDLSLYASNHVHIISGGFRDGTSASGNIRIRHIRIRASAYRGHINAEEISRRASSLVNSKSRPNGGDAIRLRGKNLEITDNDVYSSASPFFILDAEGVLIARNNFYNGRLGWYSVSGSRKVILERNEFVGGDLIACGGGINTMFSSSGVSENIWISHNTFRLMHGWDREAMTSDGPGGAYFGPVASAEGQHLRLRETLRQSNQSIIGQGIFILSGRGSGQFAQISAIEGNAVDIDRLWQVLPDESSIVTIVPMQQNYLIVANDFSDAGVAVQFFGTSVNHVVAGNVSSRTEGFVNVGLWYDGFQPSWYIQYLENRILDGTLYRGGGSDNSKFSAEAEIGVHVLRHGKDTPLLAIGVIMRRNWLAENARISIGECGGQAPLTRAVLAEKNIILNDVRPIIGITPSCDGLLRDNIVGQQ